MGIDYRGRIIRGGVIFLSFLGFCLILSGQAVRAEAKSENVIITSDSYMKLEDLTETDETGVSDNVITSDSSITTNSAIATDSAIVTDPALVINTVSVSGIRVHFLDVDHGMSVVVQCEDEIMVVDGGPTIKYYQPTESWTNESIGQRTKDYLNKLGILKLDYVVASHPHLDHIQGLTPVIKEFPVEQLLMPDVDYETQCKTNTYKLFLEAVALSQGTKVSYPKPGYEFMLGGAKVQVLSPASAYYSDVNNYSIVLRIDYKKRSFLLCQDCLKETEAEMMEGGYNIKADVVMVPHHGIAGVFAYSEDHLPFLRKVSPKYAVISNNILASYTVLGELRKTADVYCTFSSGTIVMESDGNSMDISMDYGKEPDFYASDNLILTCRDKEQAFIDIKEEDEEMLCYKKPITFKFSGNYGIHSYQEIAYQKVVSTVSGNSFDVDGKWKAAAKLKVEKDFAGWVYVRYTNEKGEYIYAKTKEFAVDQKGITSPVISSNKSSSVKGYKITKKDSKTPLVIKGKTRLDFSAVSGKSGIKEIAFQKVRTGETFDKDGEWVVRDKAVLKKGFKGMVYVRYTDGCGRVKYRKTRLIQVKKA